jgi:hypothetical protein
VELRSGANVTGDVVTQQDPVVASGATIGGECRRVQTNVNWEGADVGQRDQVPASFQPRTSEGADEFQRPE